MSKIRVFYGSTTGNTANVAKQIQSEMGDVIESITDIANATPGDLKTAEGLILGISTWEDGQLQEDWERFFPLMNDIDLTGKTVALFGLGDANGFSGEFVNAMGTLYWKVRERGGTVVGTWPSGDYKFERSTALIDDEFVGLVIDEDNESELTEARIKEWVRLLQPHFS